MRRDLPRAAPHRGPVTDPLPPMHDRIPARARLPILLLVVILAHHPASLGVRIPAPGQRRQVPQRIPGNRILSAAARSRARARPRHRPHDDLPLLALRRAIQQPVQLLLGRGAGLGSLSLLARSLLLSHPSSSPAPTSIPRIRRTRSLLPSHPLRFHTALLLVTQVIAASSARR